MAKITKEWLQQKIAAMEATRDEIPFGLDEDDSNTLAAMRIALASLEAEDGWVACSDRMPDETQPVITVSEGGVVQRTVYQFCEGVWSDWYDLYDDVSADSFTHWMPLPAAPQQEC